MSRLTFREFLISLLLLVASVPAAAETPGKDGAATVSSLVTVNQYAAVSGSVSAGAGAITVDSLSTNLPALTPGDLVLLYQAGGATISVADTAAYGEVSDLGNAGRYEFQTVASISGNTIFFETYGTSCGGLRHSYSSAGGAQVVRVPQYSQLTVSSGGTIIPLAWNGTRGGIVALHVQGTLNLSGAISASFRGFRGGAIDNLGDYYRLNYLYANQQDGAEKGESIAGYQSTYPGGRYGRGAPANGGGGGNGHNAGGGGGANGDNGTAWNGQGNPDISVSDWVTAWNIDSTLKASTVSAGGGRGGYTFAFNGDPLTRPPGDPAWGGDGRREVGGLGGRPLPFDPEGRIFFGGGGGAGDGNNFAAGRGGNGGGLVIVMAGAVTGGGTIRANGEAGANTTNSHNDAPGGGGGGGSILIKTPSLGGITIEANGGAGGNQLIGNDESEGPGGGGGGGVIAVEGGFPIVTASGGSHGTTTAVPMARFRPNGATRGGSGQTSQAAPSDAAFPFCRAPNVVMSASKSVELRDAKFADAYALPGEDVIYTLTAVNSGTTPADTNSVELIDKLPPEIIFRNDEFDPAPPVTGPFLFEPFTSGLTCCSGPGEVSYSNTTSGPPVFGYTPLPGLDPAVSYIRFRPSGAMAGPSTFSVQFYAQLK